MKREYFGILFIIVFVAIILIAEYIFGEIFVMDKLNKFVVVWILIAYSVGQYSMKLPKKF